MWSLLARSSRRPLQTFVRRAKSTLDDSQPGAQKGDVRVGTETVRSGNRGLYIAGLGVLVGGLAWYYYNLNEENKTKVKTEAQKMDNMRK